MSRGRVSQDPPFQTFLERISFSFSKVDLLTIDLQGNFHMPDSV